MADHSWHRRYTPSVFVMLLYQIGELFQAIAVENSRQSISELMDIRADEANIKVNGNIKKVPVEDVYVDDIIVIRPGENLRRIPRLASLDVVAQTPPRHCRRRKVTRH